MAGNAGNRIFYHCFEASQNLFAMSEKNLIGLTILLGAIVGSFINVLICRLPRGESIVFPGSHCPYCQGMIRWYDNVPLLSFLVLRAKCRSCGHPISWRYPAVEACMGILSAGLFAKFQLSVAYAIYFVFCAALLTVIFIDIAHQIIPDVISIPGIICGFMLSFVNPLLTWQSSLLGIFLGGGLLYAVAAGYYFLTKRDGMGGGDIKLLAMLGAFLGWQAIPFIVFISALLGSVVGLALMVKQKKGGKTMIPYGPFLSAAAMVYLFVGGPQILKAYLRLFH